MILLLWIVFGGLVGWIASIITRNNAKMGLLANIIVGLVGSALGGWIASLLGLGTLARFTLGGFLIALLGSVILLAIINMVSGRRAT